MSIRHLRTLIAIADAGSFAAAAESVLLTESAVSMQMKALEREMRVALFDRARRPPVLSEAGRALLPRAREIVRAYDGLGDPGGTPERVEGELVFGVVPSIVSSLIPALLTVLRDRHPGLHVELKTGFSADLVEQVEDGRLDSAIIADLDRERPGHRWTPFARDPLIVIAPPGTRELSAEAILTTHPFIRYTDRAWMAGLVDAALARLNIRVRPHMTLDSFEAIESMVHHGLGVSVIAHQTVGLPFPLPLQRVPLARPPVYRTLGYFHREAHEKADLLAAILATLHHLCAGNPAPGSLALPAA